MGTHLADSPLMEAFISANVDGQTLTETVRLDADSFKTFTLQESVTLEEHLDADTFARLMDGNIEAEEIARSPKLCRAVFFAKVKAAISDPRIRESVRIDGFDLDVSAMGEVFDSLTS